MRYEWLRLWVIVLASFALGPIIAVGITYLVRGMGG